MHLPANSASYLARMRRCRCATAVPWSFALFARIAYGTQFRFEPHKEPFIVDRMCDNLCEPKARHKNLLLHLEPSENPKFYCASNEGVFLCCNIYFNIKINTEWCCSRQPEVSAICANLVELFAQNGCHGGHLCIVPCNVQEPLHYYGNKTR